MTRPPGGRRLEGEALAMIVLLGFLAAGGWGAYEWATWPDVAALAEERPTTTAFIEQAKAERRAAGLTAPMRWEWVPTARISPHLKRAVVAAEDIEFFSHDGFSRAEMKVAVRDAVVERRGPRGASTITQQLAKNLWLSPSRNPLRKLKEAILTRQLETHLTKERILELYLNVVEFGPGIYGAEGAARQYFGKPSSRLTEREAAQLAASLPRPSTWHPGVESNRYAGYVEDILDRMTRATFLWKHVTGQPEPLGFPGVLPVFPPDSLDR